MSFNFQIGKSVWNIIEISFPISASELSLNQRERWVCTTVESSDVILMQSTSENWCEGPRN